MSHQINTTNLKNQLIVRYLKAKTQITKCKIYSFAYFNLNVQDFLEFKDRVLNNNNR